MAEKQNVTKSNDEIMAIVATSSDKAKWPKCDRCGQPSANVHRGLVHPEEFLCGVCDTADRNAKWAAEHPNEAAKAPTEAEGETTGSEISELGSRRFLVFDGYGNCHEHHDTLPKAVGYAEDLVEDYRDSAADGWNGDGDVEILQVVRRWSIVPVDKPPDADPDLGDDWADMLPQDVPGGKLVEAAPDLLAACEAWQAFSEHVEFCDHCSNGCGDGGVLCDEGTQLWNDANAKGKAAIAKATEPVRPADPPKDR